MWTDTHAHLDYKSFGNDQAAVIARANQAGVDRIITIGIDLPSSRSAVRIAEENPAVYASVGVHPNDAGVMNDETLREIRLLASNPKVVAFGETGLDYYWKQTKPDVQHAAFIKTIELAAEFNKPVIVHNRDAHEDVISILTESKKKYPELSGVMHCFSGGREYLGQVSGLGFYISFAGNVTYKKSNLPELLPLVPADRLLIETDAPFLSPVPFRGKRNEPAYIPYIAEKIAGYLNVDIQSLSELTSNNAKRLFRLH